MNLSITSDDIDQEELLQILQSYQRKKKYYRLKNGDLIAVSEADIEMLQQMMETLQAISLLVAAKEKGESGTALIVSPASLVYNWNEEFARFAPQLKVTMVVGNQQERAQIIKNYKESDVLVTSYDLLKRDIAEYEDAEFAYQVLDEAQYIKNHSTAAAKSVKNLSYAD